MFARAAWGSARLRVTRRTALVTGPFVAVCAWSCTPVIWSDSRDSGKTILHDAASKSSRKRLTGPVEADETKSGSLDSKPELESDGRSTWATFAQKFSAAGGAVSDFEWSAIGDKITEKIVPSWVTLVPSYIRKLQDELSWKPGTLADEILQESSDPNIHPEIEWSARVRFGRELCAEEKAFQQRRQKHVVKALARYLDIPETDIDPEDVPIIAMCGSGGGLRALVAGAHSTLCTQEAGLWDCVTYTAGVSGSCWMQTLYHSSLSGQNYHSLLSHLRKRLGIHIAFPPPALNLLASAPTNKFLLSGLLEKSQADPKADFGLVDIYGLLLAARLLVPRGELEIDARDLKVSNQRANIDDGSNPLPIYTAVRHEMSTDKQELITQTPRHKASNEGPKEARQDAWFQWFEWTPYEFWCEEMEAGIPTWGLGRIFENGQSVPRENGFELPEMRMPQLLGIWGSAFCATLSHYYGEIRPLVKGLIGFGGIDELIEERDGDLVKVHPIDPATIPNFVLGLKDQLPAQTPRSMTTDSHLQLMDAGMSNNLPIYPLLRPGRNVDVLIAFDASADPKNDNWLAKVDGYVRQRGIVGWPLGAGWPSEAESAAEAADDLTLKKDVVPDDLEAQFAADRAQQTRSTVSESLGHCTIWLGLKQEREAQASSGSSMEKQSPPSASSGSLSTASSTTAASTTASHSSDQSKRSPRAQVVYPLPNLSSSSQSAPNSTPPSAPPSSDASTSPFPLSSKSVSNSSSSQPAPNTTSWTPLPPESGVALIYFPLTPNPQGAPGVDPFTADYLSTWNFIYTPENIDAVGRLARANWDEGAEQTRRCIRAVYERKKNERMAREKGMERSSRSRSWHEILSVGS